MPGQQFPAKRDQHRVISWSEYFFSRVFARHNIGREQRAVAPYACRYPSQGDGGTPMHVASHTLHHSLPFFPSVSAPLCKSSQPWFGRPSCACSSRQSVRTWSWPTYYFALVPCHSATEHDTFTTRSRHDSSMQQQRLAMNSAGAASQRPPVPWQCAKPQDELSAIHQQL